MFLSELKLINEKTICRFTLPMLGFLSLYSLLTYAKTIRSDQTRPDWKSG